VLGDRRGRDGITADHDDLRSAGTLGVDGGGDVVHDRERDDHQLGNLAGDPGHAGVADLADIDRRGRGP
jgi:hypothetical protein